jgi:hypothetical protein
MTAIAALQTFALVSRLKADSGLRQAGTRGRNRYPKQTSEPWTGVTDRLNGHQQRFTGRYQLFRSADLGEKLSRGEDLGPTRLDDTSACNETLAHRRPKAVDRIVRFQQMVCHGRCCKAAGDVNEGVD